MRRAALLVPVLAALLAPGAARAATIDVCPNPGECDFSRIQAAVNASAPGDTVNVEAGRYQETVQVDKPLEINGAQSGADARNDRSGGESLVGAQNGGFVIADNADDNEPAPDDTTIDGFTIFRGGSSGGASTFDAGISILFTTGPVSGFRIVNNVIRDNVFGLQLNSGGQRRTIVKRNAFQANNNDGGEGEEQGNGIYTDVLASNVLVERNEFEAHQNEAMLIRNTPEAPATGVDIADNDLEDDSGIVVSNARAVDVIENTSDGNVDDDVIDDDVIDMAGNVDGANILDNVLSRYDGAGIAISDDRGVGTNRNIKIVGNTLLGNNDVSSDRGVRLLGDTYDGHLVVNFNRIFRNDIGVANEDSDDSEQINAENNWWGSNERPGTPPSDSFAGNVDVGPRLQMRLESKKSVKRNGRQLKVRASFQFNSTDDGPGGGQRFNPSDFPNGTVVRFKTDRGRITRRVRTIGGVADATLVTKGSTGRTRIRAELDGQELKRKIRIRG